MEKLSITLPTEMVNVIKAEVEAGTFASTSEVLREAMRVWMRREGSTRSASRRSAPACRHRWMILDRA